MIIKIIGAALIVSSTTALGFIYSRADKYRLSELSELEKAISVLKSHIGFAVMPLGEALFATSMRVRPPASDIFRDMGERISRKEGQEIKDMWRSSVMENTRDTHLSDEDKEELCSLGLTLGYLDKGRQEKSIALFEEYIKEVKAELSGKSLINSKLYMSMGVLSGLIIAVILL